MKQMLTTYDAASQLLQDQDGGWTWNGAQALVEYLEELEEDMGEEIEFDRVALRCDFSEYESLVEWAEGYFSDLTEEFSIKDDDLDEEIDEKIREYIHERGQLIEFNGGIIVSSF